MLKTKFMLAAVTLAASASWAQAEEVNLWVRTSSAAVLQALAEKYNAAHDDTVNVTAVIPAIAPAKNLVLTSSPFIFSIK